MYFHDFFVRIQLNTNFSTQEKKRPIYKPNIYRIVNEQIIYFRKEHKEHTLMKKIIN